MEVLHPSTWPWQPFTMPGALPVPLVRPTPLLLADPVVVAGPVAHLLSLGLGRVDMDLRWMWTWHRDGVLRLFRSWTGREVFRLRLTPLDPVPGGRWEVQAVEVEADTDPGTAERMLRSVLDSVADLHQVLQDIPLDRASALQRGWGLDLPWPPPTDEQAMDIGRRLPLRVERLVLRDRTVPLPPGLHLIAARALDDLLCLELSDGSLLWLHRAWRLSVDDTWVASDVGSVLLWPAAGWPTRTAVGVWRVRRTDGEMEAARDPAGKPLVLDDLAPDEPAGRPDTLLLLSLTAAEDVRRAPRAHASSRDLTEVQRRANGVERTHVSTYDEHLDDLQPSAQVRAVLQSLQDSRPLSSDRRSDYMSLRPALDGAIAVYAHRNRLSIALDPVRAEAAARDLAGVRLERRTPATTYLVADDRVLTASPERIRALAEEAIDWRAAGPRWELGSGPTSRQARPRDTCPNCWMEITPSGACGCD